MSAAPTVALQLSGTIPLAGTRMEQQVAPAFTLAIQQRLTGQVTLTPSCSVSNWLLISIRSGLKRLSLARGCLQTDFHSHLGS